MKMYECNKSFKTTLFTDEPKRITIEKGTLWYTVKQYKGDNYTVLSNNRMELKVANNILNTHFDKWG